MNTIKSILTTVTVLHLFTLQAQQQVEKKDTMHILLNGEKISVTVPKSGNKTTINLEDSESIIQISIGKVSKTGANPRANAKPVSAKENRHISYFSEIEFGVSTLLAPSTIRREQVSPEFVYMSSSNNYMFNKRAHVRNVLSENNSTGFHIGFSIREKRRPFLKSRWTYITGVRMRYGRYADRGNMDNTYIKAEKDSSGYIYYRDSVLSGSNEIYRSRNTSLSFLFPFILEKQIKKDVYFAAGVQVSLCISHSSFRYFQFGSSMTNSDLQLHPILKLRYKRWTIYTSMRIGKAHLYTETMQVISGNEMYCGLAYKLY